MMIKRGLLLTLVLFSITAFARGTYQTPEDFIAESFDSNPPKPKTLWINNDIQDAIEPILGHKLAKLRLVYWLEGKRSAWILEEIGKDHPITIGLVVNEGKIENIKVLIYRESRGWEVRHDFFIRQFQDAQLTEDNKLDRSIDNISGATLSVRAMKKMARLALYLHEHYAQP